MFGKRQIEISSLISVDCFILLFKTKHRLEDTWDVADHDHDSMSAQAFGLTGQH